jgi:hypothetical protein
VSERSQEEIGNISRAALSSARESIPEDSPAITLWIDDNGTWHGAWSVYSHWPSRLLEAAAILADRGMKRGYSTDTFSEEKAATVRVADVLSKYQSLQDWEKHQFRKLLELEDEAGQTAAVCGSQPTETGDSDVQEPPR